MAKSLSVAKRPAASDAVLAVDDDVEALRTLTRELKQRYGADYDVVCQRSPRRALERLEEARDERSGRGPGAGRPGDARPRGRRAADRVRRLHPPAKRGLLVHWGDWAHPERARGMVEGMAASKFDYYVLKPARPGEEQFHRIISEFLYEWAQLRSPAESEITLVGGKWAPRTHELRSFLARNGVPHAFVEDKGQRGRSLLEGAGRTAAEGPIAIVRDGPTLVNPTKVELASAFGVNTELGSPEGGTVAVQWALQTTV